MLSHDSIVKASEPVVGRHGVYFLIKNKKIIYIGRSNNVIRRIGRHIGNGIKDFDAVTYIEIPERYIADTNHIELSYIQMFKPKYNKRK